MWYALLAHDTRDGASAPTSSPPITLYCSPNRVSDVQRRMIQYVLRTFLVLSITGFFIDFQSIAEGLHGALNSTIFNHRQLAPIQRPETLARERQSVVPFRKRHELTND